MIHTNTKIHSVYFKDITVADLLAIKGYDPLVYSFNPERKMMEIAKIVAVNYAERKAVYVLFDSGLAIFCTSDHPFYMFQGKVRECLQVTPGSSVRAFSLSLAKDGHYRVHGFVEGRARHQYVARMVWTYYEGPIVGDQILHHKDFNKLNNRLDNLELLTNSNHNRVHYPYRRDGGFGRNHKIVAIQETGKAIPMLSLTLDRNSSIIVADSEPVSGCASGVVLSV